jgi:hypothetical protein
MFAIVGKLVQLDSLTLDSNSLTYLPASISNLTNLTALRVSYNRLGGQAKMIENGTSSRDDCAGSATNTKCTYGVEFEDGDSEAAVPGHCIKPKRALAAASRTCATAAAAAANDGATSSRFYVGDSVLVTWTEVFAGTAIPY